MEGKIYLTGAVRGLIPEGERVVALIESISPDAVGITISSEGLETLKNPEMNASGGKPVNVEEEVYMRGLSKYGKVVRPPPCFSMAVLRSVKDNIVIKALDMDDEHYTAAYCRYVSTMDMMRQGRAGKSLLRYRFKSTTAANFVVEWDRLVNRFAGYRSLEKAREHWFAKGICRLSEKHGKILIIVELERLPGLEHHLQSMGCIFEKVQ